ncbi:MAG: hypothetical protein RBQ97_04765 [Acholeplasma sp.]|nr:hypothetical protein [Acholeplasma sp.]
MDWLDLVFGLIGLIIGIFGTLSIQRVVIQKNKTGDNIFNEGYSSNDVTKIIKAINELEDDQIKQVKDALLEEFKNRPRVFTGSERPENLQVGDIWFQEIKADEKQ